MRMDKTCSIIIVSHNIPECLNRCLQALEKHTGQELVEELIVVDNGSDPPYGRADVTRVTRFPVELIRLDRNSSYAAANNRAVRSAEGYYVCFMNNDIEVMSGWLAPLYRSIADDERIGAVGPKMIFPDGAIQFAGYEKDEKTAFQKHRFRNGRVHHTVAEANLPGPVSALTGACLIVRRCDAQLDERYWFGCEDVDLCVQLKQNNKIIFYQPQSVVIHHEETTRSSGLIAIDFEKNRALFKNKWGRNWEELLWKVVS
jgi:GT2 family glycosyltransferase